jgi:hypothetical protein
MTSLRGYVPSIAVLRALSRPVTSRCATVHRLCFQHARGKRTKAQQFQEPEDPNKILTGFLLKNKNRDDKGSIWTKWKKDAHRFKHVERDADGTEREVARPETEEDFERLQRKLELMETKETNDLPPELLQSIHDETMQDPELAPFRDVMEGMHKEIMKTEEERASEQKEDAAKNAMAVQEYFQGLIDDPALAELRDEMVQYQAKVPTWNFEGDEFYEATNTLTEKLEKIPAFQERLAKEQADWEADEKAGKLPFQAMDAAAVKEDELLQRMSEGDESALDKLFEMSMARLRKVDPEKADDFARLAEGDPTFDPEEQQLRAIEQLSEQLSTLKGAPSPEEVEEMEKDPQMQALVEKYLDDPNIVQNLFDLKSSLDRMQGKEAIRSLTPAGAPDPNTLPAAELATLQERYQQAQRDPEHVSALRRLRINLLPPFHVHPAVKQLNQILKFAYLGANDDVRRILWRAYNKARAVPTLLESIPDDAWDMIYYSQAVAWKSNQNRDDHLTLILDDLHSLGRDGPPTRPDTLVEEQ